jgi:regulatory protein
MTGREEEEEKNDGAGVVTAITPTKRNPRRLSVFVDRRFAFAVNQNVIGQLGIRVGDALDAQRLAEIEAGEVRQEVFDHAIQYVSRRAHSRRELTQKLLKKGHPPGVVNQTLERLADLGYLDESVFAEMIARKALNRHNGRRRAEMEIAKAGVPREIAQQAIEKVYGVESSVEGARKLAEKQRARLEKLEPQVAKRRLVGMLARRGYGHEEIEQVMREIL